MSKTIHVNFVYNITGTPKEVYFRWPELQVALLKANHLELAIELEELVKGIKEEHKDKL